jgi:hypothetical protein
MPVERSYLGPIELSQIPAGAGDVEDIADYIARDSLKAAVKFFVAI